MKGKFFAVAALIISSYLHAQEDTTHQTLDEVILTASKYPQKQSETGKVVTVINRQQLEKSTGKSLGEILNTMAGVTIPGANNTLGTNQSISIRGASFGNVLILVDGTPVNDPSVITNYFDLNFFSLDNIERIEILKGGQSTLYGSDAVAGVVNIISKKPVGKGLHFNGNISGGSYNTFKENADINGNGKSLSYSLSYSHISTDGFSNAYDSSGGKNFDKDGFNQHVVNGRLGIQLSHNVQASLFTNYSYYKTGLDAAAFTDEKDYTVTNDNLQSGIGLVYKQKNGSLHFNYTFNYVSRYYFDDSVYKSNPYVDWSKALYIGRTHYAELYNNWKWNNWELLLGADYRFNNTYQYYFSSGPFGPYSQPDLVANMSQVSPYGSLIYKKSNWTLEAGGRWNHHSVYGENFTYTLNPSLLINRKAKLFVNLYSAFKTPTLYQLYDAYAGNSSLKPEKGTITEAGAEFFPDKKTFFRLTGFYRDTKNSIQYIITDPNNYTSQYQNISSQQNYGAEFEFKYRVGKWDFTANYTYTDGKTKSSYDGTGLPLSKDTTYFNLYRIPKHAVNISAAIQASKKLYISTQLHAVSSREEFIYGGSPQILKGYYTINLYGEFKINKRFKMFADLKNITNQQYFDFLGYNSRRFNFNTGVQFSF